MEKQVNFITLHQFPSNIVCIQQVKIFTFNIFQRYRDYIQTNKKTKKGSIIIVALSISIIMMLAMVMPSFAAAQESCPSFERGDANNDKRVDLSDVIYTLNYLFRGGKPPSPRFDAADTNDDGKLDISDPLFLINYLFIGSNKPPASPFGGEGIDPTPDELPDSPSDTACLQQAREKQCPTGPINTESDCFCGNQKVKSGFCCFGQPQENFCEFIAYTDRTTKKSGLSKNEVFIMNIKKPQPTDQEYILTKSDKENSNADIASDNVKSSVAIWQRYEEGAIKVYACSLFSLKTPEECEEKKLLLSDNGRNPSIKFDSRIGIVAAWEESSEVVGCKIQANSEGGLICKKRMLLSKSNPDPAYPELTGDSESSVLIVREKSNEIPGQTVLRSCDLESDIQQNPVCLFPQDIDQGYIPFADARKGLAVYAVKTGTDPSTDSPRYTLKVYPKLTGEGKFEQGFVVIPGQVLNAMGGGITLYNKPELCTKLITNERGEREQRPYIVFKDVNAGTKTPRSATTRTLEHQIWVLGLNPIENTPFDIYKIGFPHDQGPHGKVLKNPQDNGLCDRVWDKQLGPKETKISKGVGDEIVEVTVISVPNGKVTSFNNKMNRIASECSLGELGPLNLKPGEKSASGCLERVV